MKAPAFQRPARSPRHKERGVTIVLIACSLIAIMAMAALSIDVVTLYLARAEAQRSADSSALAAARVLSIAGITGDPSNSTAHWAAACTAARQVAQAVGYQNSMSGTAGTVTVTFPNNSDTTGCSVSIANDPFGVNPLVTVKVQRTDLPTFFARIWGRRSASVSATATAEAFNPSNSNNIGATGGEVIPVQPRCVKPWLVPNSDPGGSTFISPSGPNYSSITSPGIRAGGVGTGTVGETFTLTPACTGGPPCTLNTSPVSSPGVLPYVPGDPPSAVTAVPSCSVGSLYQEAIGGCDQSTVYQCGVPSATSNNRVDPGIDMIAATSAGAQCLTHVPAADTLDTTVYPFNIQAGAGNSYGIAANTSVTSSSSIVTLPIYDPVTLNPQPATTQVSIVGFLQVFINTVDAGGPGQLNVTVLNVAGCGNGTGAVSTNVINGSSPVPVRLIQYP